MFENANIANGLESFSVISVMVPEPGTLTILAIGVTMVIIGMKAKSKGDDENDDDEF